MPWTPGPGTTACNDSFVGDSANDNVDGLAGDDTLVGNGDNDTLNGGGGNDTFTYIVSDTAAGESIDGGTGTDTITFLGGEQVDFRGLTIASIERIQFSGFSPRQRRLTRVSVLRRGPVAASARVAGDARRPVLALAFGRH